MKLESLNIQQTTRRFLFGTEVLFGMVLMILVSSIFFKFLNSKVLIGPPLWDDQGYYFVDSLRYYSHTLAHGFWSTLWAHLTHDELALGLYPSSATQMSLVASFLYPIFGASRSTAFMLNLLSLLALLGTSWWVIKRIFNSRSAAGTYLFVLFGLGFYFIGPGGIGDFRLDFSVACWTGVACALWFLFFHDRTLKFVWIAIVATFVLISFRAITVMYWVWPLLFLFVRSILDLRAGRKRFAVAFLPLVFLATAVALLLIWNRVYIHEYYFQSFMDETSLRRKVLGIQTLWDDWVLYPKVFWNQMLGAQMGRVVLIVAGFALFFLLSIFLVKFRLQNWFRKLRFKISIIDQSNSMVFFAFAFLAPLIVLSSTAHKSPQVIGFLIFPFLLFFFSLYSKIQISFGGKKGNGFLDLALGALLVSAGFFGWQTKMQNYEQLTVNQKTDWAKNKSVLDKLAIRLSAVEGSPVRPNYLFKEVPDDQILSHCQKRPHLFIGTWIEGLNHNSITTYGWEHANKQGIVNLEVPRFIFAMKENELKLALEKANAAVFPVERDVLLQQNWPISKALWEHFDSLKEVLNRKFERIEAFNMGGQDLELYFRKEE